MEAGYRAEYNEDLPNLMGAHAGLILHGMALMITRQVSIEEVYCCKYDISISVFKQLSLPITLNFRRIYKEMQVASITGTLVKD